MPAGDVYHLLTFATGQNNQYMNTLAVQTLAATDPAPAAQQALADDWKNVWQPSQSVRITWTNWQLRQLAGAGVTPIQAECRREGGNVYGGTFTAPVTGAVSTTDALPPQAAMVVTEVTGTIGRRRRGRVYGFGLVEGAQDGGTFTTSTLTTMTTALNTFFNKYKDGGTSADYRLVVWSERTASGCIPNPNGKGSINIDTPQPSAASTPIKSYLLRPVVYNQRRRTLGVGR